MCIGPLLFFEGLLLLWDTFFESCLNPTSYEQVQPRLLAMFVFSQAGTFYAGQVAAATQLLRLDSGATSLQLHTSWHPSGIVQ